MKVGDIVKNNYKGLERYGVVTKIIRDKPQNIPVPWSYVIVDWIDDESYEASVTHRKKLSGGKEEYFLKEYRVDQVTIIDAQKRISVLKKCLNAQQLYERKN